MTINPDQIQNVTGRKDPDHWAAAGLVLQGDWDEHPKCRVEELEWYKALHQRFVDKKPWNEIPAIQKRINRVENGETVMDNRTTVEGVYDRCELLDTIYSDMKRDGYKIQSDLIKEGRGTPYQKIIPYKQHYHEVAVDIGREGEFLLADGQHRLSLAKILGIKEIPVRIVAIHEEYLDKNELLEVEKIDGRYPHPLSPYQFITDMKNKLCG